MASLTIIPFLSSSGLAVLDTHSGIRHPRRGLFTVRAAVAGEEKEKRKKQKGRVKYVGTQAREKHLEEMIEKMVTEAKEVCEGDEESDECRVAWDQVEEVSRAKAHLRRRIEDLSPSDPLESFCRDNPDAHDCRIYED